MARKRRKPITINAEDVETVEPVEAPKVSPQENADIARAQVTQQLGGLSDALQNYGGALLLLALGAAIYFLGGDDGE